MQMYNYTNLYSSKGTDPENFNYFYNWFKRCLRSLTTAKKFHITIIRKRQEYILILYPTDTWNRLLNIFDICYQNILSIKKSVVNGA